MATTHRTHRANRIKELRRAAGVTQIALGKRLEAEIDLPGWRSIPGWRIHYWERSKKWLPEIVEAALSEILDAPVYPPDPEFDRLVKEMS